jgi:hypothetical protein
VSKIAFGKRVPVRRQSWTGLLCSLALLAVFATLVLVLTPARPMGPTAEAATVQSEAGASGPVG